MMSLPFPSLGARLSAALLLVAIAGCATPATPAPPSGPMGSEPAASAATASPGPASPGASASPAPPSPGAFDPAAVAVTLEPVVDGLASPLGVTHAGDGSGRLFVVEQAGTIRIVRDRRLEAGPFLDITGRIRSGGERGLLGLAFHPDYPRDPRLFVNYTDQDGHTQIASFTVDPANADRALPDSEVRYVTIRQPYPNHNGGALAFGPDGYLYIAAGDGGSGGDPHGFGQSLETLLGKIARIDIDAPSGDLRYTIPADNPLVERDGARPEIWLSGLRNPWRMSFDRATGDLWIGDVGQNAWEEIDVARAGVGGANFGWSVLEGRHCFRPRTGCEDPALTLPVTEYLHEDGGCTVIGGNVYRGTAQPALVGGYLFADYCSGLVWAIDAASDGPTEPTLVGESGTTPSAFGEDEAGELYVTDLAAGTLLEVIASAR